MKELLGYQILMENLFNYYIINHNVNNQNSNAIFVLKEKFREKITY